jgi:hypothetical protein
MPAGISPTQVGLGLVSVEDPAILAYGTVNTDGTYTIGGLAAGSYPVQFIVPTQNFQRNPLPNILSQYWTGAIGGSYTTPGAVPVSVSAGATTSDIDATIQPGTTISGTVASAVTGQPLADVSVDVYPVNDPIANFSTETSSNGTYFIDQLPPGTYGMVPRYE